MLRKFGEKQKNHNQKKAQKKKESVMRLALGVVKKQQTAMSEANVSLPYDNRKYRRALVVAKPWLRSQG